MQLGLISLDFDTPEECIREASRRKVPLVELYTQPEDQPAEASSWQQLADAESVMVHSVSSMAKLSQAEEDLDWHIGVIRQSIDLAARLHARFATFMFGGNQNLSRSEARARFLRRLEPLAMDADARGVTLLVENVFSRNPPGDLDNVEDTLILCEKMAELNVWLNFDFGNFLIAGEEAYPYAWATLSPYVRSVHLKDACRFDDSTHGPLDGRRALDDHVRGRHFAPPLGTGALNTIGVVRTLHEDPRDIPVMLEPSCKGAHRDEWLTQSLSELHAILGGEMKNLS